MPVKDRKQLLDIMELLSTRLILRGTPGEYFHLYFHVPFSALSKESPPSKTRKPPASSEDPELAEFLPFLDSLDSFETPEPDVYLTALLCRDAQVLLAAAPYIPDASAPPPPGLWNTLRQAGLVLLEDCCEEEDAFSFSPSPTETAALLAGRNLFRKQQCPALRFQPDWVVIPPDLWPLLAAKGILSGPPEDGTPSAYGRFLGLLHAQTVRVPQEGYPGNPPQIPRAQRELRCPPGRWASLWGSQDRGPAWEHLSLDERIARLEQQSGGTNPGHFTAAVLRLMEMPLDVYMTFPARAYPDYFPSDSKNWDILNSNQDILRQNLGDLSAYTFVQALQKIDALLSAQPTKSQGRDLLLSIATPIRTINQIKALKQSSKSNQ